MLTTSVRQARKEGWWRWFAVLAWSALALSYLAFAGQATRSELVAGFVASVAAAAFATTAHRRAESPMNLWLRWDRVIGMASQSLLADTFRVGIGLLRPMPGAMSSKAMSADDSMTAGRRGVAVLALSLAPNGYVLRVQGTQALTHTLVPTERRRPPT
jgi:hypothetical protein